MNRRIALIVAASLAFAVVAVASSRSRYEQTALTAAAPTSATDGISLTPPGGANATLQKLQLSVRGADQDAGITETNRYLTGGTVDCYRYATNTGWSKHWANVVTLTGDGGLGSNASSTRVLSSLPAVTTGARYACKAAGITLVVADGGHAQLELEAEFK